jgi:hypothetical protein
MKIISGGQTGADRGALEAAKECGHETGGYAPKQYATENGSDYILASYNLIDSGMDYVGRTELNVKNSDVTIWFGNKNSAGYAATRRACKKYCKFLVDVTNCNHHEIAMALSGLKIVNVAGNRESHNKGIQEKVKTMMMAVLNEIY